MWPAPQGYSPSKDSSVNFLVAAPSATPSVSMPSLSVPARSPSGEPPGDPLPPSSVWRAGIFINGGSGSSSPQRNAGRVVRTSPARASVHRDVTINPQRTSIGSQMVFRNPPSHGREASPPNSGTGAGHCSPPHRNRLVTAAASVAAARGGCPMRPQSPTRTTNASVPQPIVRRRAQPNQQRGSLRAQPNQQRGSLLPDTSGYPRHAPLSSSSSSTAKLAASPALVDTTARHMQPLSPEGHETNLYRVGSSEQGANNCQPIATLKLLPTSSSQLTALSTQAVSSPLESEASAATMVSAGTTIQTAPTTSIACGDIENMTFDWKWRQESGDKRVDIERRQDVDSGDIEASAAPRAPAVSATSVARGEAERIAFERLYELSSDREGVLIGFQEVFAHADKGNLGHLQRDDALDVLDRVFRAQHSGLPASSLADEWPSLLKRFGVYGADDAISFQALLELYMQAIGTLRDCFAPRDKLRQMRRVLRGAPRLKDQYDHFDFRAKDTLGKVYSCRDTCTREARSCRQVRKDKASVPIDQIRRNLARLTQLEHTGMPQVCAFLEDFHNFYVISAPVEGIEIMDMVQESVGHNQALSEAWVARVVKQILEVCACCHSQPLGPVIHRDLKPENIWLSAEEHPRVSVTNFGIQVLFDFQNLTHILPPSCMPTSCSQAMPSSSMPELLAPEIWRKDYGPKCDIWSCGCLLFLLLTGCLPFGPHLAVPELVRMILAGEPDWRFFRHVSTSALSLCRRMLSREDMVRPSARDCLRHPWFASFRGDGRQYRELRLETNVSLMQFHANAKLQQVIMNLVAAELKVSDLRRLPSVFASFDPSRIGLLTSEQFEAALVELGVMPQSVSQVLHAVNVDGADKVPYGFFIAGCVDLVDDKLDHMLWKVFSMVDEDHSGEVGIVELEHLFASSRGEVSSPASTTHGSGTPRGFGSNVTSATCDVEKYLRGVLDPNIAANEAVACMAGGRKVVGFEDLKRYIIEGPNGFSDRAETFKTQN